VAVILGSVTLDGFEVSGALRFGGKQALTVHRLPGGGRVIDALGPDDADISWAGILSGGNAADRARLLDGLRRNGLTVTLAWDSFLVAVVVGELLLDYTNPWWIPYRIRCVVAPGVNTSPVGTNLTAQSAVLTDLGIAGGFTNIGAIGATLNTPGAFTEGTSTYAAALGALSGLVASTDAAIATTGEAMSANDIPGMLTATGALANLSVARGYLARANANFMLSGS
jgi:hypothetical protein